MSDFQSTPYDGQHPVTDPGNDWRGGTGVLDDVQRLVSYGNYAGPGNRILTENPDYVKQQRDKNPDYNENTDPRFANDPRYKPIDGLDAAAQKHDTGYPDHLKDKSGIGMFTWDGMQQVKEDDRTLVSDTQKEMAGPNGGKYSDGAKKYADGLEGFFGARVMGMDAANFADKKAGEAESGVSNFVDGAKKWGSVDDAVSGIGNGLSNAGNWLADTGSQAVNGIENAGNQLSHLGAPGIAGAGLGFGNVAVAGAAHLASNAWDGAKSLVGGAEDLFHHFAD